MKPLPIQLSIFLLVVICSCKKSVSDSTDILLTVEKSDSLRGNVTLFDEGQRELEKSGMLVSIENSSPLIRTTTNTSGKFVLPIDPALQTFTLVYSKAGFGTFKRYFFKDATGKLSFLDLNDSKVPSEWSVDESLGSKSTIIINQFKASIDRDTLRLQFNISSNATGEKYIRLLYQKDLPTISFNTIDKTNPNWSHKFPVVNGDNTINLCLKCSIVCSGWTSGDRIYMTAYGDSYYSNMFVEQPTKKLVLSNMNLDKEITPVSIVVP